MSDEEGRIVIVDTNKRIQKHKSRPRFRATGSTHSCYTADSLPFVHFVWFQPTIPSIQSLTCSMFHWTECIDEWQKVDNAIFDLDWLPGQGGPSRLVTASGDMMVMLWDVKRKHCISKFKGHVASVKAVRCRPDSERRSLSVPWLGGKTVSGSHGLYGQVTGFFRFQ